MLPPIPRHTPGIWPCPLPGEGEIWQTTTYLGWGIQPQHQRGGEFDLLPWFHVLWHIVQKSSACLPSNAKAATRSFSDCYIETIFNVADITFLFVIFWRNAGNGYFSPIYIRLSAEEWTRGGAFDHWIQPWCGAFEQIFGLKVRNYLTTTKLKSSNARVLPREGGGGGMGGGGGGSDVQVSNWSVHNNHIRSKTDLKHLLLEFRKHWIFVSKYLQVSSLHLKMPRFSGSSWSNAAWPNPENTMRYIYLRITTWPQKKKVKWSTLFRRRE